MCLRYGHMENVRSAGAHTGGIFLKQGQESRWARYVRSERVEKRNVQRGVPLSTGLPWVCGAGRAQTERMMLGNLLLRKDRSFCSPRLTLSLFVPSLLLRCFLFPCRSPNVLMCVREKKAPTALQRMGDFPARYHDDTAFSVPRWSPEQ